MFQNVTLKRKGQELSFPVYIVNLYNVDFILIHCFSDPGLIVQLLAPVIYTLLSYFITLNLNSFHFLESETCMVP